MFKSDLEGYLFKRGEINRSFQRRYCILKGNLFFYYDKKTDREPIGVIILENFRVELAANEPDLKAFHVVFYGSNARTYIFGSDKDQEMERWMQAISRCGFKQLKHLVCVLRERLDEVTRPKQLNVTQLESQVSNQLIILDDDEDVSGSSSGFLSMPHKRCPSFIELHEYYRRQFKPFLESRSPKILIPNIPSMNRNHNEQTLIDLLL